MKTLLVLLAAVVAALYSSPALAQGWTHTPLKGISVTLQSMNPKTGSFALQAITDDDGKFTFGYVPPGMYALGCSYVACYTALSKVKHPTMTQDVTGRTISEDPAMHISVNACEGLVCRIAVGKMTPDDWSSNTSPAAKTTITKEWSNTRAWLNAGGGVTVRIDGSNIMVSGKIEAQ